MNPQAICQPYHAYTALIVEMCPAGRTGLLCETDLNTFPVRCPVGWAGDECSVKLCNKFFWCANGASCDQCKLCLPLHSINTELVFVQWTDKCT